MAGDARPQTPPASVEEIADRLHSAAIRMLRGARQVDAETGLSAARLSALSVVVHAGPLSLGELAAAEQVRAPTMTRLVQGLVEAGLVTRETDPGDRRISRVRATAAGRRLLDGGRRRRVAFLAGALRGLGGEELGLLEQAAHLLLARFGRSRPSAGERSARSPGVLPS